MYPLVQPHLKRPWCIKAITASFLWQMENILDLYSKPYDSQRPLICADERPCYLIGDVLTPIPMSSGQSKREDCEYERKGSCTVFMAFEPGTGQRWVQVYQQRRVLEYKKFMEFVAKQFPRAERIKVAQDNSNTHQAGSFYTHLEPAKAFRLAKRFEFHFTPKHASWLNMRASPIRVLFCPKRLSWNSLGCQNSTSGHMGSCVWIGGLRVWRCSRLRSMRGWLSVMSSGCRWIGSSRWVRRG